MTQPKCGKCNTLNLPGFPCSTCDPAAFERHRAAFNGLTVGDIAPRKTGPYSAEELAGLRALTEHHDPTGMTRRLLATLDAREAERDEAMALLRESQRLAGEATQQALDSATRLGKMTDAARALLEEVEGPHGEWMGFCEAPRCRCLAMCGDGYLIACDEHRGILIDDDIEDMSYAPTVRALRALLADPSPR